LYLSMSVVFFSFFYSFYGLRSEINADDDEMMIQ